MSPGVHGAPATDVPINKYRTYPPCAASYDGRECDTDVAVAPFHPRLTLALTLALTRTLTRTRTRTRTRMLTRTRTLTLTRTLTSLASHAPVVSRAPSSGRVTP